MSRSGQASNAAHEGREGKGEGREKEGRRIVAERGLYAADGRAPSSAASTVAFSQFLRYVVT